MSDRKGIRHSRRRFIQIATQATLVATALPCLAEAADLPRQTEVDPMAVALSYKEDANKIDPAKAPTYKKGQTCATCRFFQGPAKASYAPCQLFPGKSVNEKGWCSGYNAKQ